MTPLFHDRPNVALLGLALLGLVSGLVLLLAGLPDLAKIAWTAGVVPVLAALCVEIVRSLWKGEVGLDIVAALSMSAALLFGETLAAVADAQAIMIGWLITGIGMIALAYVYQGAGRSQACARFLSLHHTRRLCWRTGLPLRSISR